MTLKYFFFFIEYINAGEIIFLPINSHHFKVKDNNNKGPSS